MQHLFYLVKIEDPIRRFVETDHGGRVVKGLGLLIISIFGLALHDFGLQ